MSANPWGLNGASSGVFFLRELGAAAPVLTELLRIWQNFLLDFASFAEKKKPSSFQHRDGVIHDKHASPKLKESHGGIHR